MTDVNNASDPSTQSTTPTSFVIAGNTPDGSAPIQDDGVVVLEHGGRKFTKSDLLKKITNADDHIERLTKERAEDRALMDEVKLSLKKQVDMAEVLKQIKESKQVEIVQTKDETTFNISEVVEKAVNSKLSEAAVKAQRDNNWRDVSLALNKAYGDKVDEAVKAIAKDSDMTFEEAIKFAQEKPKAFLKLFPVQKPTQSPLHGGSVNTQSVPTDIQQPPARKPSKQREEMNVYLNRLRELGIEPLAGRN